MIWSCRFLMVAENFESELLMMCNFNQGIEEGVVASIIHVQFKAID